MSSPPSDVRRAPDFAKCFGIILVVFGHVLRGLIKSGVMTTTPFWSAVDRDIYLFHMPLFFYLSGLFFERTVLRSGYLGMTRRNALNLLLPMAIWSYLQIGLQYVTPGGSNEKPTLLEVILAPVPPHEQFWFLGALFLVMGIAGFIALLKKPTQVALIAAVALFVGDMIFASTLDHMLQINEWQSLAAQTVIQLPYFLLGIVINAERSAKMPLSPFLSLASFIVAMGLYQLFPDSEHLLRVPCSIVCVLSTYKLMEFAERQAPQNKAAFIAAFIGMNSMIIYLAHVIFAATFRTALLKVLHLHSVPMHLIGGTVAGLLLPLLLVPLGLWLMRRHPLMTRAALPVRFERQAVQSLS